MQSFGLALTLSLLTGTLVALDFSDAHTESPRQTSTPSSREVSIDDSVNALSIMPNSVPGILVPKADISNGVFSVGSSTGKEGLDNDEDVAGTPGNNVDDEAEASDPETTEANDFVLI